MPSCNKQLAVLSEAEEAAFYECPSFSEEQRFEYFTLTDDELQMAMKRQNLSARVHCILQIGYFKAVKLFFNVAWGAVDHDDLQFILQQYFSEQSFQQNEITKYEYYAQYKIISTFFSYRMWCKDDHSVLYKHAVSVIQRDTKPQFIALELLSYLNEQKIIRPKYTTLQTIVSAIINEERKRLTTILHESLTPEEKSALQELLVDEGSLSKLAGIKQDARNFKARMISRERDKWTTLKPLYQIIQRLLPILKLSQQNIQYYSDLAEYYTVYDLRKKIKTEQSHLYLLCYVWKRYQEINDNLITAFGFHFNQFEDSIKEKAKIQFSEQIIGQYNESLTMKQLAQFWVDDSLPDDIQFGAVREKVFSIISREELKNKIYSSKKKSPHKADFYWQAVDCIGRKVSIHLRPLVMILDFSSTTQNNPWLAAIEWMKNIFAENKSLAQQPITECPEGTLPAKQEVYLSGIENPSLINAKRYEFWVYRQIFNQWKTGHIFLKDSLLYRSLNQELVSLCEKDELIKSLKIPAFDKSIEKQLDALLEELKSLWECFNKSLKKGDLLHLRYDEKDKTLHIQKINLAKEEKLKHQLYGQLPLSDITDVFRFVHKSSNFFSAFTHIQPRYAKLPVNEEYLIGTIIAQAMNSGNFNMAAISDIPYATLQDTLQSHLRLSTLKVACDLITEDIAKMPIFHLYSFDPKFPLARC